MGATLDLILEYDASEGKPFSTDIEGVIDFTKSFNIAYSKPYAFMQAIAGIRGNSTIVPKVSPRGFPKKMNHLVEEYFRENHGLNSQYAGWLTYSEMTDCLANASLSFKDLGEPLQLVMDVFRTLTEKFGESRVRIIFGISP